jgi:spore germination protein KA
MFKKKKLKDLPNKKTEECTDKDTKKDTKKESNLAPNSLSKSLEENIKIFKKLFKDDDTLVVRRFENELNNDIKFCILFTNGMISSTAINDNIIKPIMLNTSIDNKKNLLDAIMYHVLFSNSVEKISEVNKVIESIVSGDTILFVEGSSEALTIDSKGWQTRAIEEPDGEKIIRGPREGFTESLIMNISMVRRKLATNNLKFKFRTIGVQSQTKICLCYIEGIVNNQILMELNKRLDGINIDGITASGPIVELIKDSPLSLFKTVGSTERPDVVAGKLLDGRIAIIVDGTPVAITVPHIFIEYFQVNEDYYINFYYSSINRLLRILSFILTISLTPVYIALTSFHQEMVPTPLIRSISSARQSVPFPTVVEVIILLIAFEILREAGTRMPTAIGQALSIVGALVLGQAAVEARIVSAPVVIIVALTGITGLVMPRFKGAEIILRIIFLLLSSVIGLYGYIFGIVGLLIHLFSIRSFGVPYMLSLMTFNPQDIKDTAIRVPWMYMKNRPKIIAPNNRVRNTSRGMKK